MIEIDLNADMGESFGMYALGNDRAFMKYVTSANVACGFHAGDYSVMRTTVMLGKEHGVQVGAHPGLPDLQGFGRREMMLTPEEVYDIVVYQVGALQAFAQVAGTRIHHVKPHGSLYGMAHRREEIADAICRAAKDIDPSLCIYLMKKGVFAEVAESMGLKTVYELYSDLGYDDEGNLVITRSHDSYDPAQVAERVKRMVVDKTVSSVNGKEITIEGNSVCVHSDTPGALDVVKSVREALEEAGCTVVSPAMG